MIREELMQIENFKYIDGKQLLVRYIEKDGYGKLIGFDEIGTRYELSKIKIDG